MFLKPFGLQYENKVALLCFTMTSQSPPAANDLRVQIIAGNIQEYIIFIYARQRKKYCVCL